MRNSKEFERQLKFITYYLLKGSYTYSNARRSALKAGYSDSYARKITTVLDCQKMEKALITVQEELQKVL